MAHWKTRQVHVEAWPACVDADKALFSVPRALRPGKIVHAEIRARCSGTRERTVPVHAAKFDLRRPREALRIPNKCAAAYVASLSCLSLQARGLRASSDLSATVCGFASQRLVIVRFKNRASLFRSSQKPIPAFIADADLNLICVVQPGSVHVSSQPSSRCAIWLSSCFDVGIADFHGFRSPVVADRPQRSQCWKLVQVMGKAVFSVLRMLHGLDSTTSGASA